MTSVTPIPIETTKYQMKDTLFPSKMRSDIIKYHSEQNKISNLSATRNTHINTINENISCFDCNSPNSLQTKFHKGFFRKPESLIQQDTVRKSIEDDRLRRREAIDNQRIHFALIKKQTEAPFGTVNVNEDSRSHEFPKSNKRYVDPSIIFHTSHKIENRNRFRQGRSRFFEYPSPELNARRQSHLTFEGIDPKSRINTIVGLDAGYDARSARQQSVSVKDNFGILPSESNGTRVVGNFGRFAGRSGFSQIKFGETA